MLERRGGDVSKRNPEGITQFQTRILTTGVQLQAEGFDWWHAIQMIDALKERRFIKEWQRSIIHVNLATLQKDGLIRARWGLSEKSEEIRIYFQVTEEGEKERSIVPVTSDYKSFAPGFIPTTIDLKSWKWY